MKFLAANPALVAIRQDNWTENYQILLPELNKLQVVSHGVTSMEQAQKWLECVCKVHSLSVARTCITHAGGLGARDIRSLIAFEKGEYYPALSVNEIYQSKQLMAFPLDFRIAKNEESFVFNAIREILAEKYGVSRDIATEKAMLNGNDNLWLRSRPSMYGKIDQNDVIMDIHVNRGERVTHSDEMRLHYHELVAHSIGLKPTGLFQVNVQIENGFKEQLVRMAKISNSSESAAKEILKEAIRHDAEQVVLSNDLVQPNESVFNELVRTGKSHWEKIIKGVRYESQLTARKVAIAPELIEDFTVLSKRLVVSQKMAATAKIAEDNVRNEMSTFAMINGINQNVAFPYEATQLREYNQVDYDALFATLTAYHNIPREQLQKRVVDIDKLVELANAHQIDISHCVSYKGRDTDSICAAAEQVGVNLTDYTTTTMRPYVSGQSRGPVRDALNRAQSLIEQQTESTLTALTQLDSLDHPNLSGGLKDSGVSLVDMEMDF